jgi:hypothetical protein
VALPIGRQLLAFVFSGTLYMQQVLRYSALHTGAAWLAASVTSIALCGVSRRLITRSTALTGGLHQTFWVLGAIALIAPPAVFALVRRIRPTQATAKPVGADAQRALATTS